MHGVAHQNSGHPMTITDAMIRPLKALGMSDNDIGARFGVTGGKIKNLRFKYKIPSVPPQDRKFATNGPTDGWPVVMDEEKRAKHWARYFKRLGHDHSADDLRFKSTGRILAQPDSSHMHRLGATSLVAMELF